MIRSWWHRHALNLARRAAVAEHTVQRLRTELDAAERVLQLQRQAYRRLEAAEAGARRVLEVERAERARPRLTTLRPTPTDPDRKPAA